jgi:hypothetical protein
MLWTIGFARWIHARLRIDRAASSVMLNRIGVSIDQELSHLFSSHLNILHSVCSNKESADDRS